MPPTIDEGHIPLQDGWSKGADRVSRNSDVLSVRPGEIYRENRRYPLNPYTMWPRSIEDSVMSDHHIWSLSVRCYGSHNRLAQELERVDQGGNVRTIKALADDRRSAVFQISQTPAQTLHGVFWKKEILFLFLGSGHEAKTLLASCLSDCDRLLGGREVPKLQDIEPCLARAIGCVVEIGDLIAAEVDHYDNYDADSLEGDRAALVARLGDLASELEAAVAVVSRSPAKTFAGIRAKLELYELCAERGGTLSGLSPLGRSMFDDLARLVGQEGVERGLPIAEEIVQMV